MAVAKDNSMKMDYVFPVAEPSIKVEGRDAEIQELIETLYKKRMRNRILVGKAGVGKTELVREVASRVKDEYAFFSFDMGLLSAGTQLRGSFEDKLKSVVNNTRIYENNQRKKVVLFVDEIHTLCTVGGCRGDRTELTAANILKPYISSGEITLWGATTYDEYKESIGKDLALVRRMPLMFLSELTKEQSVQIVNNFLGETKIEGMGEMIVDHCDNIPGSYPDKCIELADRVQARVKYLKMRKPSRIMVLGIVKQISEEMEKGIDTKGN